MSNQDDVSRTQLPIPDIKHQGLITYDAKDPDTKFPPIRDAATAEGRAQRARDSHRRRAGTARPAPSAARARPRTSRSWRRAGCSTRASTRRRCARRRGRRCSPGRNHHSVGMGGITEIATAAPGQCSVLPNTKAPLALTLKLNGYATAQFGKCHEVPVWQTSPAGPFNAWPTGGGGFEYFYGFIGGENNQWDPALYEGTTPIEPPKTPAEGYHLTEDLTDKFIAWTRQQKALLPDKPFFVYFAPGATHAPHHVPKEWIDKYKGKFAHGWDKQREITFNEAEGARRDRRRRGAHRAAQGDSGLGRDGSQAEAGARARDGGVRRVHGAHRPSRGPDDRLAQGHGRARQHADLSHHRRQRRVRRRHAPGRVQRDGQLQRRARDRNAGIHDVASSTSSAARSRTVTTRWAGRGR